MRTPQPCISLLKTVLPDSHLTLHYRVSLPHGVDVVSTFGDKPATLLLGNSQLHPAFEQALIGMSQGAHCCVALAPEQAFGPRRPELVRYLSRRTVCTYAQESDTLCLGDWLAFQSRDDECMLGQVKAEDSEGVLLDFNHPLAGQSIVFAAQIVAIL
jgi:FKBP-type peptidyl-prolyl cis-trans isomerase SlpA